MGRSSHAGWSSETPGREWIDRAAERVRAALDHDGVDLRRLRQRGFQAAALDKDVLARHNRRYSLRLPFGQIENQERSGNCWLFAPTVLVRAAAIRNGRITATESFSETYLYFFNLLLRASASLARIGRITAREDAVGRDTLRRGLSREVMGLADGGEWEWAFNLIETYGLVPSGRMPETASARSTQALNVDLHERLARATRAIAKAPKKYDDIREEALLDVMRILVAHLGTPPSAIHHRGRTLTPTEYAEQVVGFCADEWRIVISNPLLEFHRVYVQRGSAITHGAKRFNLQRLNVPQRRMRTLVRASLEAGHAVGFSADVDRNDIDHDNGIMHPRIFNRARLYGGRLIRDLPRRDDIYFGTASSKHAMAIVGLDQPKPGSAAIKYRVANSWGPDLGDHGIYHMYAEWFEENVFKLAVHERVLNDREREAYAHPERLPGGRFY
jgi:bleomycin hydrolase